MNFIFSLNTQIVAENPSPSVANGISILRRDMNTVFHESIGIENRIILKENNELETEMYVIDVNEDIIIQAKDNLGFIYGLLHISATYLDITPFWFWMNQVIDKKVDVLVPYGVTNSKKALVRFRGWFYNDEVLMLKWNLNGDKKNSWRMAFEALLRCGGNMAIPGTDVSARLNADLANEYGLWITHHHAEPLGAEMFSRVYPGIRPNYSENAELFHKVWEDAIIEQSKYNVVWNVGFRGQGDCPFWSTDNSGAYDTPAKRGKLISELIEFQRELVKKHVKDPVFCTNLYGEVMELYDEGHIHIDDDIIKVSADNGYGKMVTRRRDNHSLRLSSLPKERTNHGGIYYHVSFYDLQAANHITMLPNSVNFVNSELNEVIKKNATDFWAINCSNVKPHIYYLDAVMKKWYGEELSDETQSIQYANTYFEHNEDIANCFKNHPQAMIPYGIQEDEHLGEQFYNESIRIFTSNFIKDRTASAPQLHWLTGKVSVEEQVRKVVSIVKNGEEKLNKFYQQCVETSRTLEGNLKARFDESILLHAVIHYQSMRGVLLFGEAYEYYVNNEYKNAFIKLGFAAEAFDKGNHIMRASEHGAFEGFYYNDCFADMKHTAYMCRKMMGVLRELGDNTRHDKWYRDECYSQGDRDVFLLLVLDNHMTDEELFEIMKKNRSLA